MTSRERKKGREREGVWKKWERGRERERDRETEKEKERKRESERQPGLSC